MFRGADCYGEGVMKDCIHAECVRGSVQNIDRKLCNLVGHRDRWRIYIHVKFLWQPSVQWVRVFLLRDTTV
jgi:hypothetical protein